jgi:hypothetical protein
MNMTLIRIRVPATLLVEAKEAARLRGISLAALFRDAMTMRLEVTSLADAIKQEMTAEIGGASELVRAAGREFYASAADALAGMAGERQALGEIVNQIVEALDPQAPVATAATTSAPANATKRAPGSAPR